MGPEKEAGAIEQYRACLETSVEAARKAGQILLTEQQGVQVIAGEVRNGTLQTRADLSSERAIIDLIDSHYAVSGGAERYSMLAEESGYRRSSDLTRDDLWLVDPLDGTSNYTAGKSDWGVMISFFQRGEIRSATIFLPSLDKLITGLKDDGVYIGDQKITKPPRKKLEESVVIFDTYGEQRSLEANKDRGEYENMVGNVRGGNCSASSFFSLITGQAQVYLEYKSTPWDDAAGAMLVKEMGGIVTDFEGNEWTPEVVASTGGIVKDDNGIAYEPAYKNLIATFDRGAHERFVAIFKKVREEDKKRSLTHHKGLVEGVGLPNSLEGILKNWRGNLEADAIILSDGEIAVIHPGDFDITLKEVEGMNVREIEALNIPPVGKEEGSGRKEPLLQEFFGLASDAGTATALEIKASTVDRAKVLSTSIVRKLAVMKSEGGLKGNESFLEDALTFESFCVSALNAVKTEGRKNKLNLKTVLYWPSDRSWANKNSMFEFSQLEEVNKDSITWPELGIEVAAKNNINSIELFPNTITPELIQYAHTRGVKVNVGLVKDKTQIEYLFSIGVDHILTE